MSAQAGATRDRLVHSHQAHSLSTSAREEIALFSALGQCGSALFNGIPFLMELVVYVALRRPLVLFTDIVKPPRERVGGLRAAAKTIVKRGRGIDTAILSAKALD